MRRTLPALAAACLPSLAACSLIAGGGDGPDPTISPPPGMKNVSWGNYAFGVPSDWTIDYGDQTVWRDPNGNTVMTPSGGSIIECPKPAKPGDRIPDSGQTYTSVRRFHVPGAAGALRSTLTGGQGGDEVELEAWLPGCKSELILDIYDTDAADRIADTLIAQPD
jgi:hypothetical protein